VLLLGLEVNKPQSVQTEGVKIFFEKCFVTPSVLMGIELEVRTPME
jgi:hypothetical protein